MTSKDGKPCKRCGGDEWYPDGRCAPCVRECNRRWKKANPDKLSENSRRWQRANPDRHRDHVLRWKKANPEKNAAHTRRWANDNPEKNAARKSQWRRDNPEKSSAQGSRRRTLKTMAGGSYTAAEWKALLEHYGNRCLGCGRDDVKLEADHVVPVAKGGTSNIDNIQPLCRSCNARKRDKEIDYRPGTGLGRWIQKKIFG